VDDEGNVFLSAVSFSQDFPVLFPYQSEKSGQADIVVSKFDGKSGDLIFSTYWGGSRGETGPGRPPTKIAIAPSGYPFIGGNTRSIDIPLVGGVAQTFSGGEEGFVFGLSGAGDSVIFSSYVGGSSSDGVRDIAFDRAGFLCIVGFSASTDFETVNALQPTRLEFCSAFVRKLEPVKDSVVFSTYFGGNGIDHALTVTVDNDGRIYIAGFTESQDFPLKNPFQDVLLGGFFDGFISILSENGDSVLFSTYLNGAANDFCRAIVVDSEKNFYVCGETSSSNFPVTQGSIQPEYGGSEDGFIFKFAPLGSALLFGTYFGGRAVQTLADIKIANEGSIIAAGITTSGDFKFVPGLIGSSEIHHGIVDGMILSISGNGDSILYSGTIGGQMVDIVSSLAIGPGGEYYVAGTTNSRDFSPLLGLIGNRDTVNGDLYLLQIDDLRTAIDNENESPLPKSFALHQNYPNPFNPTTNVRFTVPFKSNVLIEVFNVLGQRVVTLEDRVFSVGEHISVWNAESLPSGVYYIRL